MGIRFLFLGGFWWLGVMGGLGVGVFLIRGVYWGEVGFGLLRVRWNLD